MTPDLSQVSIHRLTPADDQHFSEMLNLFAEVFNEPETYISARPPATYRQSLLAQDHIIALVAVAGENVVGALVAYELMKFEQARSEVYIYDLAVAPA